MSTHGYLADKPGRSCVVLPICASKYGCLVNQNGGLEFLKRHRGFAHTDVEQRYDLLDFRKQGGGERVIAYAGPWARRDLPVLSARSARLHRAAPLTSEKPGRFLQRSRYLPVEVACPRALRRRLRPRQCQFS